MCALFLKGWYGTQDASAIWQDDYAELLKENGYATGTSNAAAFYSKDSDARALVHGDDFAVLGDRIALERMDKLLKGRYSCKKMYTLGDEDGDDTEAVFLNRRISLEKEPSGRIVIHYQPDARHEDLSRILDAKPLDADKASKYRSVTMRAAYLAQDRPDIAEAAKSLAQGMSKPTEEHWSDLKRLGRYIAARPQASWKFEEQKALNKNGDCRQRLRRRSGEQEKHHRVDP
jgi:hypothetical protein